MIKEGAIAKTMLLSKSNQIKSIMVGKTFIFSILSMRSSMLVKHMYNMLPFLVCSEIACNGPKLSVRSSKFLVLF